MKDVFLVILIVAVGFLFINNKALRERKTEQGVLIKKITTPRMATVEEKAKCFKDGATFYEPKLKEVEKYENKLNDNYFYDLMGEPKTVFNTTLNTCLIAWGDMQMWRFGDRAEFHYSENITDVYTNKNLYTRIKTSKLYNDKTKKEENTETAKQEEYWLKLDEYGL